MDMTILTAAIVFGLVCILVGAWMGWVISRACQIANSLEIRVKTLEDAGARRLTHSQAAGLEDAMAVLIDANRHVEQLRVEADAMDRRLEKELKILQTLREGPHAYDVNTPAGRR